MRCASHAASRDEDRRRGWYRWNRSCGLGSSERIGVAIGVKIPAIVIIPATPIKAWVRFADFGARVSLASFATEGPSRLEAGGHRWSVAFDSTAGSGSSGATGILRIINPIHVIASSFRRFRGPGRARWVRSRQNRPSREGDDCHSGGGGFVLSDRRACQSGRWVRSRAFDPGQGARPSAGRSARDRPHARR